MTGSVFWSKHHEQTRGKTAGNIIRDRKWLWLIETFAKINCFEEEGEVNAMAVPVNKKWDQQIRKELTSAISAQFGDRLCVSQDECVWDRKFDPEVTHWSETLEPWLQSSPDLRRVLSKSRFTLFSCCFFFFQTKSFPDVYVMTVHENRRGAASARVLTSDILAEHRSTVEMPNSVKVERPWHPLCFDGSLPLVWGLLLFGFCVDSVSSSDFRLRLRFCRAQCPVFSRMRFGWMWLKPPYEYISKPYL